MRKHIATIAQLLAMGGSDLEQLSNHLRYEKTTRFNFYRKTDKLKIAKVSELLLRMEKKSLAEYQGKSVEEIDLEVSDLVGENEQTKPKLE